MLTSSTETLPQTDLGQPLLLTAAWGQAKTTASPIHTLLAYAGSIQASESGDEESWCQLTRPCSLQEAAQEHTKQQQLHCSMPLQQQQLHCSTATGHTFTASSSPKSSFSAACSMMRPQHNTALSDAATCALHNLPTTHKESTAVRLHLPYPVTAASKDSTPAGVQ